MQRRSFHRKSSRSWSRSRPVETARYYQPCRQRLIILYKSAPCSPKECGQRISTWRLYGSTRPPLSAPSQLPPRASIADHLYDRSGNHVRHLIRFNPAARSSSRTLGREHPSSSNSVASLVGANYFLTGLKCDRFPKNQIAPVRLRHDHNIALTPVIKPKGGGRSSDRTGGLFEYARVAASAIASHHRLHGRRSGQ